MKKYKVKFKVNKLPMKAGDSVPIIFIGYGFDCFTIQLLWLSFTVEKAPYIFKDERENTLHTSYWYNPWFIRHHKK